MIFKNDPQKESAALKQFVKRLVKFYLLATVVGMISSVIMSYYEYGLIGDWWTWGFVFGSIILIMGIFTFKGYKRVKKNYSDFSFEITDDEMIIKSNSNEKRIKISDIKQMAKTRDSVFLVSTGSVGASFYIHTQNIENEDELLTCLNQMMERLSKENVYVPNKKDNFIRIFFGKKIYLLLTILISLGFLFRHHPIIPKPVSFLLAFAFFSMMGFMAFLLTRSFSLNRRQKIYIPILLIIVGAMFLVDEFLQLL